LQIDRDTATLPEPAVSRAGFAGTPLDIPKFIQGFHGHDHFRDGAGGSQLCRNIAHAPARRPGHLAHLPRLLNRIDWAGLNLLITECFGAVGCASDWVAVDGKVLRGSSRDGERQALVIAVAHATGHEVARLPQTGPKTSEIPVVRQLLKDTGLERQKVTMDAGHCNPTTLSQIAHAGGTALVQVKGNQPELLYVCASRAVQEPALARLREMEKMHGRLTTWTKELLALRPGALGIRWDTSELRYLVTVLRETYSPRDKQTTRETSYYVTNAATALSSAGLLRELTGAIRGH
jgi:hypothetical protein